MPDRVFTLRPELPHYFWKILAGILLIPLFGYGLYLLFTVYKKRSRTEYQLSDRSITTITPGLTAAVDLANVETVDIVQKFGDKWFNIGTLMVRTDHRTLKLEGVKDPGSISEIIQTAAETLRSELEAARKAKVKKPEAKPGVIDKMNYLTGLWQQGLISEEDFERERKYFEE